jgi:hypothetical protein
MIESLRKWDSISSIHVLALDDKCRAQLERRFRGDGLLFVYGLEDIDTKLITQLRQTREHREFCWTLGSVFSNWIMDREEKDLVYLDADIYFFGNPGVILNEIDSADLAAIPHRFPERLRNYEINGRFNVQWVYFKASRIGRHALNQWASQCIDCCDYAPERGIIGDQKYLDEWPSLYATFREIEHLGAGVAPWNHELAEIKFENEQFWFGAHQMIFFHFHNLRIQENGRVQMSAPMYEDIQRLPINLYRNYLAHLAVLSKVMEHAEEWPESSAWRIPRNDRRSMRLIRTLFTRKSHT